VTASGSAACENAAVEDINANENADAPKTRARECLARKAILPQPVVLSFGSGWRAPLTTRLLAGYRFFAIGLPLPISHASGYAALWNRSTTGRPTLYRL
jgi:hypothetical protein